MGRNELAKIKCLIGLKTFFTNGKQIAAIKSGLKKCESVILSFINMKNKVIIVGDSYTFGHGCSDRVHYYDETTKKWVGDPDLNLRGPSQHCWATLAQRDFPNFEFINLALPGNSNDAIFKSLSESIDLETKLVIFAGSFANRMLIKSHNDESVDSWIVGAQWLKFEPTQPTSYLSAKEMFIKHLYHNVMGENISVATILGSWALAILHQAEFMWSFPIGEPMLDEKNLNAIHMQGLQFPSISRYRFDEMFNIEFESILAVDRHVNDLGHKLYYQQEIAPRLKTILQ